jgi:hypothetical protein
MIVLFIIILCLTGCPNNNIRIEIPRPDDAQYHIRNVAIQGPAQIRQDPTRYTVTFEVVVQTDGGAVTPLVTLLDSDDTLRFDDDLLEQRTTGINPVPITSGIYQGQAVIGLSCSPTFDVIGSQGTSEEGGRIALFNFVDEAEIYARVSRADGSGAVNSTPIDVDCAQP